MGYIPPTREEFYDRKLLMLRLERARSVRAVFAGVLIGGALLLLACLFAARCGAF